MSTEAGWRDERNGRARERLARGGAAALPMPVMVHALARRLVPPQPSLAVASYWRHHPLRADRLARALAARSAAPDGWNWRLSAEPGDGRARTFRAPPAPYREAAHRAEPGRCCLCGQPVFRFGWHRDLWDAGAPNRRARWHGCCVAAWKLWNAPAGQAKLLGRLQRRRCAASGRRLPRDREVDHRVPLHLVWRHRRDEPWAQLLGYWGFSNLQAVAADAHRRKTGAEAAARAAAARGGDARA